jgi:hypothetical protein
VDYSSHIHSSTPEYSSGFQEIPLNDSHDAVPTTYGTFNTDSHPSQPDSDIQYGQMRAEEPKHVPGLSHMSPQGQSMFGGAPVVDHPLSEPKAKLDTSV